METLDDDCEWPKQFQEIKKIDSLLRCSICFEFFNIAVVVPACSHNYCSYCIRKHILYKKHCPTCYIPLLDTDLKCNRVLDELVLYFKIVRKKLLDILNKFYSFTGHSDGPNDVSKCTEIYQDAKIDSDEFEPVPNFRIAAKPSSQKKTSKISKKQKETIISNDLNKCFAFHNTTTGNPSNLGDVACCPVCNDLIPIKRINIHLDGCLKAKERSLKTANMKSKQSEMKTLEDAESKMIEDAEDDEIHFSSLDIEVAHDQHENYTKSCDKQENISKRRVETANDLILSSATILMKPLAKVCLDSLSEKQLRNKAKSFGLPIKGDRKALTQRINRYILLYNSQCDSSKPLSAQEIATEVLNQEKQLEIHGYKANVLLAVQNALRYFPENVQEELAFEFAEELNNYGHIYMYRFQPSIEMKAYPIDEYPCNTRQAAAIMLMIMNNLDPNVAQFPNELVTYGGNGHVFSNWAQFLIVMNYLSIMSEHQTLVMYSGHPMGLFPSNPSSPRAVITNGMVIPNYSSKSDFEKMFALGVTMYGQMTAGSYCYIGPQGIVHGTTLTILNAGRKYLKTDDLSGKVFVTSGLGGMSGAQPKAGVITGCVTVVAEVSKDALLKRYNQGWLCEIADSLEDLVNKVINARDTKRSVSIGYLGNIVEVWEHLVDVYKKTGDRLVDMGSDQTSLHNPFNGGYYPVQLSFEESNKMMHCDPENFKKLVQESLRRHVNAINFLSDAGMYFWDYGNAFLLEASRAGGDVSKPGAPAGIFKYPTYVQDIMGDIFSMGFGPFRWVCTTGLPTDLEETDKIAEEVLKEFAKDRSLPEHVLGQINDNIKWIQEAAKHGLVVGSQARILYCDQFGRSRIAVAMNNAIKEGRIKGPIVISRDHHDVSGTDSPFRETSNIYDGSSFCADMAVQNCIGDSFRGATWVALHNGGGCGWGEVINGGFGLVLDGSQEAGERANKMLAWDVSNGVARRAWCGHPYAQEAISRSMNENEALIVTKSHSVGNMDIIEKALQSIVK